MEELDKGYEYTKVQLAELEYLRKENESLLVRIAQLEAELHDAQMQLMAQDMAAVRSAVNLIHAFGFDAQTAEEMNGSI